MVSAISAREKSIWTGVYSDLRDHNADYPAFLFTVAESHQKAEAAFEQYIMSLQSSPNDVRAPDVVAEFSLGASVPSKVCQLHAMGYKFVFPCAEDVSSNLDAQIVKLLLKGE